MEIRKRERGKMGKIEMRMEREGEIDVFVCNILRKWKKVCASIFVRELVCVCVSERERVCACVCVFSKPLSISKKIYLIL